MAEYIDKAKAVENIKELMSSILAKDNYAKGYDAAIGRALIAIREESAVDVQPVKHGRWLPSDSFYITTAYGTIHCQICSKCGANLMKDNDYDYDFCPVCGAKMDEKE